MSAVLAILCTVLNRLLLNQLLAPSVRRRARAGAERLSYAGRVAIRPAARFLAYPPQAWAAP